MLKYFIFWQHSKSCKNQVKQQQLLKKVKEWIYRIYTSIFVSG